MECIEPMERAVCCGETSEEPDVIVQKTANGEVVARVKGRNSLVVR